MNILATSEQQQLQDTVAKYLRERYPFDVRQRHARSSLGWSESTWGDFAALGLLALVVPEAQDGYGGKAADLLPVMTEFGRALVVEPFLSSAVLATSALAAAPAGDLRDRLLARLASGEQTAALAVAGSDGGATAVRATQTAQGWTLDGHLPQVLDGGSAPTLLVALDRGRGDCTLFAVDMSEPGVHQRGYALLDQSGAADVRLEQVRADALGPVPPAGGPAHALGTAALCAQAAGAVKGAFDLTLEYVKSRTQFGRTLSEYQVVRHQLADMQVLLDQCEGMALLAAIAVDAPESVDAAVDLARAKWFVGRYGCQACEIALQLHGGIGMSDEYPVGHYLQRLVVIDSLLGSQDEQLDLLLASAETP